MNREALIRAAQEAGFSCTEREIRDLTRERLLRVLRREGKGRSIIVHHAGDALRLQVILALRQPQPLGFDIQRFEKLRSWLGSVDGELLPDEAMPAVAYVLQIPGVLAEDAISAFTGHIQFQRSPFDQTMMERAESTFLPSMAFIFAGFSAYQGPDIYKITDTRTVIEPDEGGSRPGLVSQQSFTLRDEIAAFVPPALHPQVDPDSLAQFARVMDPRRMEARLRQAPDDRLVRAAGAARVLFAPLASLCPEPYALSMTYVWAFFVSLMGEAPATEWMAGELGSLPPAAIEGLDGSLDSVAQFVSRRKDASLRRSLSAGARKGQEAIPSEGESGRSSSAPSGGENSPGGGKPKLPRRPGAGC